MEKDTLFSMRDYTVSAKAFSTGFYAPKSNDCNTGIIPQDIYKQHGVFKRTLPADYLVCSQGFNVISPDKAEKSFDYKLVHHDKSLFEHLAVTAYLSSEWSLAYSNTIYFTSTDKRAFRRVTYSSKHDLCLDSSYITGGLSIPGAVSSVSPGLLNFYRYIKNTIGVYFHQALN